jgi:hypothetical protein
MSKINSKLNHSRRVILPVSVFILTFILHYIWHVIFPENNPIQEQWVIIPDKISMFDKYIDSQNYWFGYIYSICFAFIAVALRSYKEIQCKTSQSMAFGGITFGGIIAATGCFVIGCCGSPMLIVWINLFGVKFLPFAKPLLALLTTVSIGIALWWMRRKMIMNSCQCNEK